MTMGESADVGAEWRPDPQNPRMQRWWDGVAWTNKTRYEAAQLRAEPLTAPPPAPPKERSRVRPDVVRKVLLTAAFLVVVAVLLVLFVMHT
jgi:hypothetical protein